MSESEETPGAADESRDADSATEGEHLDSPQAGHPAGETQPPGGIPRSPHEHPENVDETTPNKQSSP